VIDRDSSRHSATGAKADRILEQALKHELSATGTPPAGAPALRSLGEGGCLDAETLGAWTDGGLDPAAVAACEAHVASCARCQALVGAFARSHPERTDGTPGAVRTEGTLSLWRWWLAPIAAGVTAATLWTVIPEQPQVAVAPPQAKSTVAAPPPAAAAAADATPPAVPDQQLARERTEARDNLAATTRADQPQLRDAAPPKEEAARLAESITAQRQEAVPAAPAATAPAATAPAAAPPATTGFEPLAGLQKSVRSGPPSGVEIPTLRPSVRWRIVGDFFIELTEDGGASWQRKHQLPGVHVGSAPSGSVCWLAGANGSVWLTTDGGATFRNVGLAEPLAIASVSATDAQTASIFTVSGRRFRTEDGGRTWLPF
jgi:cytoskeletal protein RodZ